ncbi:hypothetical protein NKH77_53985 [Streptomyces sp. M19]
MTLEGTMEIGGRRAMTLSADLAFMSQRDYDVFRAFQRARSPSPPRPPRRAARWSPPSSAGACRATSSSGTARTARRTTAVTCSPPTAATRPLRPRVRPRPRAAHRRGAAAGRRRRRVPRRGAASPHAVAVGCEAAFLDFGEFEADLTFRTAVGEPGRTAGSRSTSVSTSSAKRWCPGASNCSPARAPKHTESEKPCLLSKLSEQSAAAGSPWSDRASPVWPPHSASTWRATTSS